MKNKNIHKLIRLHYNFDSSLVILEKNKMNFIINSGNKIIIFHNSLILSIKHGLGYYLFFLFSFIVLGVLCNLGNNISYIQLCFIISFIILYLNKKFHLINEEAIINNNFCQAKMFILLIFVFYLFLSYSYSLKKRKK